MLRLTLLLALAASANAGDFFVDPVLGSDTNSGLSAAQPVATITRALLLAGNASALDIDAINLAPGLYSTQETWPLVLDRYQRLNGPNPATCVLSCGGAPSAIELTLGLGPDFELAATRITGVTFLGDADGIDASSDSQLLVERCDFQTSAIGIHSGGNGQVGEILARNCAFIGGQAGVLHDFPGTSGANDITLQDCTFEDLDLGFTYLEGLGEPAEHEVLRCSFVRTTTALNLVSIFSTPSLLIEDSTFWGGNTQVGTQTVAVTIRRCTFVDPTTRWIQMTAAPCTVDRCIQVGGPLPGSIQGTVSNSLIEDPAFLGMNGNLAGTASFVDRANGDFRLTAGSLGIDAYSTTATDHVGFTRDRSDGDLNATPLADLGAHEFRVLDGPATAAIGTTFDLTLSVPNSEYAWVVAAPLAQAAAATIFGERWLDPSTPLTTVALLQAPATTSVPVPNDPTLIGTTLTFQALVRSPNSATGAAWTNPWIVEIE